MRPLNILAEIGRILIEFEIEMKAESTKDSESGKTEDKSNKKRKKHPGKK